MALVAKALIGTILNFTISTYIHVLIRWYLFVKTLCTQGPLTYVCVPERKKKNTFKEWEISQEQPSAMPIST